VPNIFSKCCELVKLCHTNHSSPVFLDIVYIIEKINVKNFHGIEVHRSSVNAEHRPNIRPKASARFSSATLQHSAELR